MAFAIVFACFPIVAWIEPGDAADATDRTLHLLAAERRLGLDVEHGVHRWLAARPVLPLMAEALYLALHVSMLVGVFAWLGATRPTIYRRLRNLFIAAHVLTIAIYLRWPTAPPRLVGGVGPDGPAAGAFDRLQYEYAAVPSGHVVFALVVAVGLQAAPSKRWRFAGLAYPAFVTVLVVATGHHLLFDAFAAVAVVLMAMVVLRCWKPLPFPTLGRTTRRSRTNPVPPLERPA
jgi:hypothetical protein